MVSDYFTYRVQRLVDRSGPTGMSVNGLLFFMQMEYRYTTHNHVTSALKSLQKNVIESNGRWRTKGHHETKSHQKKETVRKNFAEATNRGSGRSGWRNRTV